MGRVGGIDITTVAEAVPGRRAYECTDVGCAALTFDLQRDSQYDVDAGWVTVLERGRKLIRDAKRELG